VYSLIYERHRSWYSFVISTLVGAVYTFGFIMMCPQLYLNYKLKSVAHLPWKMLTYKALGTVIDDLFAFIIVMPTMHRLACFRDDIIFIIYLYQKYKYPTDPTRVNEFGVSKEDIDKFHLQTDQTTAVSKAAATAAAATETNVVETDSAPSSSSSSSSPLNDESALRKRKIAISR